MYHLMYCGIVCFVSKYVQPAGSANTSIYSNEGNVINSNCVRDTNMFKQVAFCESADRVLYNNNIYAYCLEIRTTFFRFNLIM